MINIIEKKRNYSLRIENKGSSTMMYNAYRHIIPRKHERFRTKSIALIRFDNKAARSYLSDLINISKEGVCISQKFHLEKGDNIYIQVNFNQSHLLKGKVCWANGFEAGIFIQNQNQMQEVFNDFSSHKANSQKAQEMLNME